MTGNAIDLVTSQEGQTASGPAPVDSFSTCVENFKSRDFCKKDTQVFFSEVSDHWQKLMLFEVPSATPLDEAIVEQLGRARGCQDAIIGLVNEFAQDDTAIQNLDVLVNAFGDLLSYKYAHPGLRGYNPLWLDHYRFLLRELFLCTVALLLRYGRHQAVDQLLSTSYLIRAHQGLEQCSFVSFDGYVISIDEYRKRRVGLHADAKPSVDMMMSSAQERGLSYAELLQADMLLCLRGALHFQNMVHRWVPRLLTESDMTEVSSVGWPGETRAARDESIKLLLGFQCREELRGRLRRVQRHSELIDCETKNGGKIQFDQLLGLEI